MIGHKRDSHCTIQPIIPFVQSHSLKYSKINHAVPKIKSVLIPKIGLPSRDPKVANAGFILSFL